MPSLLRAGYPFGWRAYQCTLLHRLTLYPLYFAIPLYYIDDFEALIAKVNELYDEAIATMEELRQKFSDLENIETKAGAQEKADAAYRL